MRIRRRRAEPVADATVIEQPAVPPEAAHPSRRRGSLAAVGLVLAVLLLAGAMMLAPVGDEGDVLALGPAPEGTDLAPVEDFGSLGTGTFGDPSGVGPGDPAASTPAAGDPAAAAAAAAAAPAGGTPAAGGAGPATAAPGTPAGASAPVGGVVPNRGPGTGGGGGQTPSGPGTPPAPPPAQPPAQPPPAQPPAPTCAITNISVAPNSVRLRSSDARISADVTVTFQPTSCPAASYRVQVKGLDRPAEGTGDGFFAATIDKNTTGWSAGNHTITIVGGGTSATANLNVS